MRVVTRISFHLLFASAAMWAQTSQISGIVKDSTGAAIAGAAIKATQIKAKGKIVSPMEIPFTIEISTQKPDKIKANIDIEVGGMNITIVQVVNGKKGWANVMGTTKELDGKELSEAQEQFHIEEVTNLVVLKDKGYKLSLLGEAKVKDKDCIGVQVTKKDRRDVNLYFDKATFHLAKQERRALDDNDKEVTEEAFYSGYKEFSGVKMPTKEVVKVNGRKWTELTISDYSFPAKFDASTFAKP